MNKIIKIELNKKREGKEGEGGGRRGREEKGRVTGSDDEVDGALDEDGDLDMGGEFSIFFEYFLNFNREEEREF